MPDISKRNKVWGIIMEQKLGNSKTSERKNTSKIAESVHELIIMLVIFLYL